jgi:hypothetical protein
MPKNLHKVHAVSMLNSLLFLQLLHFLHGAPSLLLSCLPHFLPSCLHVSEVSEDIQNQKLETKATPRAMEATYHWKRAPFNWLSTPSLPERLGQDVWTPYAPTTW